MPVSFKFLCLGFFNECRVVDMYPQANRVDSVSARVALRALHHMPTFGYTDYRVRLELTLDRRVRRTHGRVDDYLSLGLVDR